jgi:hypothetical protein
VTSGPGQPGSPVSDESVRAAFAAVAGEVHVAPDAYRTASTAWRRRYRRRRLTLAVLAAVVFALADVIGLWALNSADPTPGVIFSDPAAPDSQIPSPRIAWP